MPSAGLNYVKFPSDFSLEAWRFKVGVDVGLLRLFTVSALVSYNGTDLEDMIQTIVDKDLLEIVNNSTVSVGFKFWF